MAKRIRGKKKPCKLRLLTEAEREVILRDHSKKVKIQNPVIAGTVTLVLCLILLLVFVIGGVELMLPFLPLCLGGIAIIVYVLVSMMVVLHKVRTNKLRVAEELKRGDKVIVIRGPGLVYKARRNR